MRGMVDSEQPSRNALSRFHRLAAAFGSVGLGIAGMLGGLAANLQNSTVLLYACVACFCISVLLLAFSIRFTLHDLFWLTALMALALGWWADHRQAVAYRIKVETTWSRLAYPGHTSFQGLIESWDAVDKSQKKATD
jgi:hypothetical protein